MMGKQMAISAKALRANADRGPVFMKLEQVGTDQARVFMSLDFSRASVPELSYFADYCDVHRKRSWVDLVFGKLADSGTELRTKVEVAFPTSFFNRQLWASSAGPRDTAQKFVGENAVVFPKIPESREKIQTFRANSVFLAMQSEEAVLDFYYLSAKEVFMLRAHPERDAILQPVIRICTDTYLMDAFFKMCAPLVDLSDENPMMAADSEESE
jgi:hypothetical protein